MDRVQQRKEEDSPILPMNYIYIYTTLCFVLLTNCVLNQFFVAYIVCKVCFQDHVGGGRGGQREDHAAVLQQTKVLLKTRHTFSTHQFL